MYTSGETASLHIDVKNNSNVDIDSFIVKVTSVLPKVFPLVLLRFFYWVILACDNLDLALSLT